MHVGTVETKKKQEETLCRSRTWLSMNGLDPLEDSQDRDTNTHTNLVVLSMSMKSQKLMAALS